MNGTCRGRFQTKIFVFKQIRKISNFFLADSFVCDANLVFVFARCLFFFVVDDDDDEETVLIVFRAISWRRQACNALVTLRAFRKQLNRRC